MMDAAVTVHEGEAYILRTCAADMTSHGGFVWPREGRVEAPDWREDDQCGGGLHGFLWGEGDGDLADWSLDAVWIVARVGRWINLGGKVKAPWADVVHVGDRMSATSDIISRGARGAVIGATVIAGDWGTATAGHRGTATAGHRGIICVKWWDGSRFRLAVGYVGEDGIKADTPYRVDGGKLVEA